MWLVLIECSINECIAFALKLFVEMECIVVEFTNLFTFIMIILAMHTQFNGNKLCDVEVYVHVVYVCMTCELCTCVSIQILSDGNLLFMGCALFIYAQYSSLKYGLYYILNTQLSQFAMLAYTCTAAEWFELAIQVSPVFHTQTSTRATH